MVSQPEVDMAIDFKKYCINNTLATKVAIPTVTDEVPEMYKPTMERVLTDLSGRVSLFDHTSVPYIQDTIDRVTNMDNALKPTNGDIPDALIETVSTRLYGKSFNDIAVDEQSIIFIISLYICVAKNSKLD